MIRNNRLKRFLQNYVFSIFSVVNKRISHNSNIIMLYSNMGFRDNIKDLYDYLIENKYNKKYTIICSMNDWKRYSEIDVDNVKFISNIRGGLYYFVAGFVYYCFGKIPIKPGKKQEVLQMWHGSPYKAPDESMLTGHSWKTQYYTHVLSASKNFIPIWSYCFSFPEDKIIVTGQPRNDTLFKSNPKYDFGTYSKLILWTPTFRQSTVLGYSNSDEKQKLVPILEINDYVKVNEYLRKRNVKIIVKLHPMQDLSNFNRLSFDNLMLMSHKEFLSRKLDLYKLMPQCDALITDYSSIFYDYLLIDRPIAFTEDDLENYTDKRGFVVDDPQAYKPGMRIKTIDDLYQFIDSVVNGRDNYKADRDRVNKWANDYRDGQFSRRVLECVGIVLD